MNKLDKNWFSKFQQIGIFDDITFLKTDTNNYQEQKRLFLNGQVDQPVFKYVLPLERLDFHREGLLLLRQEMINEEKDDALLNVYLDKIYEQLLKLDLIKAVQTGNDELFRLLSQELYGQPSKEELILALGTIVKIATEHGIILGKVISGLQTKLSISSDEGISDFSLSRPTGKKLNAQEIKSVFEKRLTDLGIDWNVVISNAVVSIVVSYENRSINIPTDRTDYESVILGLLEHEIGVHVTRHLRGKNSRLELLSVGLPHYLESDEGLAAYYELQRNQSHIPGLSRYVGISLAAGLVDGKNWNFREVFGFFVDYFTFLGSITGRPGSEDEITDLAWLRSYRVFRGVTSVMSGAFATRDIAYWRGYLKMSKVIKSGTYDKEKLLMGKYDPTNISHVKTLQELKIL